MLKQNIDINIDLNSNIITGIIIGVIGAAQQNIGICAIGVLQMFGRKGLDKAVEIVKIIYENKVK